MGRVLALFKEKSPHLFLVSGLSSYPRKQDLEPTDESMNEAMDDAMDEEMEDSLIGKAMGLRISPPEAQETPSMPEHLIQFDEAQTELDGAQAELDEAQADSIKLMLGSMHQGWRRPGRGYEFTIRHVGFSINTESQPAGGFWVKAELSRVGERHPHVWATHATLEDPGSRLAIRVGIRDSDGREIATEYPSSDTWQAWYKANRIVDELNGDSCLEISKRPRRHIFVDARHKGLLRRHPELEIFVGGAFTGNNGEFISTKRPKRPRGGKEPPKGSDKEGHKKFKQEEVESDA